MKKKNNSPLLLAYLFKVYPVIERYIPALAHAIAFYLFFSPFKFKRPTREDIAFCTAEKKYIIIKNRKIKFFKWGVEGNPIIVMIHGWGGRATQFHKFIQPLVVNNYHIVAFDAPAHGLSEGRKTNIKDFYEILAYIESNMGKISIGIGHSFGGVSLLFSKKEGIKLDSIIMISSPSIGEDIFISFTKKINASSQTIIALKKMILEKYNIDFEEVTAHKLLQKITVKNHLIVHDKEDIEVPYKNAEVLKETNPYAQLFLTDGLGHTRILRDEMVIKKIIKFINTTNV